MHSLMLSGGLPLVECLISIVTADRTVNKKVKLFSTFFLEPNLRRKSEQKSAFSFLIIYRYIEERILRRTNHDAPR